MVQTLEINHYHYQKNYLIKICQNILCLLLLTLIRFKEHLLLIRKITHDHDFPIVLSENTIGWFSFYPANKIIKNIRENENGYFAIKEWSGGSVVTFHLYVTNPKLKKIKEITTKNDLMFEK